MIYANKGKRVFWPSKDLEVKKLSAGKETAKDYPIETNVLLSQAEQKAKRKPSLC